VTRRRLAVALALTVGVALGSGTFTFHYGHGSSYLTNDPEACANCHVMSDYLAQWGRSSHRAVAVCNDCHAPHDIVGKLATKAINGWNHSVAFTTGNYPVNLRMTPYNRGVTEEARRYCHAQLAAPVDGVLPGSASHDNEPRACLTCHAGVGHPDGTPIRQRPASEVPNSTAQLPRASELAHSAPAQQR